MSYSYRINPPPLTNLHHYSPGGEDRLLLRRGGYKDREGSVSVSGLRRSAAAVGGSFVPGHVFRLRHRRLHLLPALPLGSRGHHTFLPAQRVQQHWMPLLFLPVLHPLIPVGLCWSVHRELLRSTGRGFPRAWRQRQHRSHDDNRTQRREPLCRSGPGRVGVGGVR